MLHEARYAICSPYRSIAGNLSYQAVPPSTVPGTVRLAVNTVPSRHYSILITDDDSGSREALREIVEPEGYRTLLASSGEEAVDIVREENIHLFKTIMFRSSTTVEEARSNADEHLLHWTVRRRFKNLFAELHARIASRALTRSPLPHAKRHRATQQSRTSAPANA